MDIKKDSDGNPDLGSIVTTLGEHERRLNIIEPIIIESGRQIATMANEQQSQGREIGEIKQGIDGINDLIGAVMERIHRGQIEAAEKRSKILIRLAVIGSAATTVVTLAGLAIKFL